jgi:hypothetical protein
VIPHITSSTQWHVTHTALVKRSKAKISSRDLSTNKQTDIGCQLLKIHDITPQGAILM